MHNQTERLFKERLVKDIMVSTAFCVKDILQEDKNFSDDDIYEFIETSYCDIIRDTLEVFQNRQCADDSGENPEVNPCLGKEGAGAP